MVKKNMLCPKVDSCAISVKRYCKHDKLHERKSSCMSKCDNGGISLIDNCRNVTKPRTVTVERWVNINEFESSIQSGQTLIFTSDFKDAYYNRRITLTMEVPAECPTCGHGDD